MFAITEQPKIFINPYVYLCRPAEALEEEGREGAQ